MLLRFALRHVLAVTTLFAMLLAIGTSTNAIRRDSIWVVESVSTEDWGGSWHGEDPMTGEPTGGAVLTYVATLRDGDRVRTVCVGDDFGGIPPLPTPGDQFVFTGLEMPRGKPIFPGSTIYTGPPQDTYFAVDDHTLVLAAQATDGYPPILNVVFLFIFSVAVVGLIVLLRRLTRWLLAFVPTWRENRRQRREHYRRTHIV